MRRDLFLLATLAVLVCYTARAQGVESQPSTKAVSRAKQLRSAVSGFELTFFDYYEMLHEKSRPGLMFSVARRTEKVGNWHEIHIDSAQANMIIEHLMLSGFLDNASDREVFHERRPAENPCIVMTVEAEQGQMPGRSLTFQENLGWGVQMFKRLEALRKVLKGDAGEELDWMLKDLEKHNTEWEKQRDPLARVKVSPEGWELRIWEEDTVYFSLLPELEDPRAKHTDEEFVMAAVTGFKPIKRQLRELRSGQMVYIYGKKFPGQPPKSPLAMVRKYCKKLGLETEIP